MLRDEKYLGLESLDWKVNVTLAPLITFKSPVTLGRNTHSRNHHKINDAMLMQTGGWGKMQGLIFLGLFL
ncbi:MAG: hypothetical protein ACYC02_02830 [Thiobacillus sp.]